MKRQTKISIIAAIVGISALIVAGCSDKNDKGAVPADREIATASNALFDQPQAPKPEPVGTKVTLTDTSAALYPINDLLPVGNTIYSACDGALLIRKLDDTITNAIAIGDNLRAVALHDGLVYVGGQKLYTLADDQLVPLPEQFETSINVLYSYGPSLMIGTDNGLFSQTPLGIIKLKDSITVSALTSDGSGLWVGTDGEGLYRWDGEKFQKRFLSRDESLFNNVTALAYNHNHLYLGTDQGLFIHDGGKWNPIDFTCGLPSNVVTAIDASDWIVYVGTDKGLVSYFKDEFKTVEGFSGQQIAAVRKVDRKLVVATTDQGLFVKTGNKVSPLVTVPRDELQVVLIDQ
jgi:ligand-binding sensor domain-containing protein